jgi:TPP-dependent pyruvate/acetoin dehydrogenase alpha subunit
MKREDYLQSELLRIRVAQLTLNKLLTAGEFSIPVHLAIGHEAIAVSVVETMGTSDLILLNHRNLHYHLALGATLVELVDEYKLKASGLSQGKQGSMNLTAPKNKNIYTSNILGNNLGVALGVSKSQKMQNAESVTWVVTGDGAIEEGSFYETLLCSSSWQLPLVVVVENNRWSLGTEVSSRRIEIGLERLTQSLGVGYVHLKGNHLTDYVSKLNGVREIAKSGRPIVVEVDLESLGGYFVEEAAGKRYINYHAGSAKINRNGPLIEQKNSDPLFANGLTK